MIREGIPAGAGVPLPILLPPSSKKKSDRIVFLVLYRRFEAIVLKIWAISQPTHLDPPPQKCAKLRTPLINNNDGKALKNGSKT